MVSKLITTSAKIVSYLNSHYTGRTWIFREVRSLVASSEDGLQARVCQAFLGAVDCGRRRIANSHAKALGPVRTPFENRTDCVPYRRKSPHWVPEVGTVEVFLSIVYRHTSLDVVCILTFISWIKQNQATHRHE